MRQRIATGMERIDTVGGKLVARFFGVILLAGIVAVVVPVMVSSFAAGSWWSAVMAAAFGVPGLLLVRYLFSPRRRLSDIEQ